MTSRRESDPGQGGTARTGGGPSRLLLADDHSLVRETIAAFLASDGSLEIHCEGTLDAAIAALGPHGPFDLILLDLNMPGMNGLDGMARMQKAAGATPVGILSANARPDTIQSAIAAGARGYLPKSMPAKSLSAAVRFMISGEIYFPYNLLQDNPGEDDAGLRPREREVLQGLAEGLSNREIADRLHLQEVTVKLHVKTLSRKLDARNRTHAAMIAKDAGIV